MTACKNCATPITDESPPVALAERKPCPTCGSTARLHQAQFSGSATATVSATAVVINYPEALLSTAQRLIAEREFSIAAVVAHMACEISAERALSRAFAAKGIGYLEEPLKGFVNKYNLGDEHVRTLYNALTGNAIQKQPFWEPFKASTTRRNKAVHEGRILTKAEAEASLKAASDLVAFVK